MLTFVAGTSITVNHPEFPRVITTPPTFERTLVVPVQGPPGPAGGPGKVHIQETAAATWTVSHNFGRRPSSVTIYVDNEIVDTDIYSDFNTVVLTFAEPTSGEVHLI